MPVPVLNLNLAPRPSLWRERHQALGWGALALGLAVLLGSLGLTWRAYHMASRAGRDAVSLTEESRRASRQEQQILASLQDMDATREQTRWKVAERILQERGLPWSRLTAELEQCMVADMRLKGIQRSRSNTQQVVLKLKGEARTRDAEAAFVETLRKAPVFAQVILERESERQGGGWDFELSLPAVPVPPPFEVKAVQLAAATAAPQPAAPAAGRPGAVPAPPRAVTLPGRAFPPAVGPTAKAPAARIPVTAGTVARPGAAAPPPVAPAPAPAPAQAQPPPEAQQPAPSDEETPRSPRIRTRPPRVPR